MRKIIILNLFTCCILLIGCNNNDTEMVKESIVEEKIESKQIVKVDYYIKLSATSISEYVVKCEINTNIPLPVEVMASINLIDQNPDDLYIGYSEKVVLKDSIQTVVLNSAYKKLPSGNYTAEITYYPQWGAENGNPKALEIKKTLKGKYDVLLKGSGVSATDFLQKKNKQFWVMENVWTGINWDKNLVVSEIGTYQELVVTCMNPDIIKAYYFTDADMTIFVRANKQSVLTWEKGQATCP